MQVKTTENYYSIRDVYSYNIGLNACLSVNNEALSVISMVINCGR